MKVPRLLVFVFIPIAIILLLIVFIKPQVIESGSLRFESPLPRLFTNTSQQVLAGTDYWKPQLNQKLKNSKKMPNLTAQAVLVYDLTTDQLIAERNSKKKLPIASLTKIMTATVAIENEDLDEQVTISKSAADIGENSMGLTTGEKLKRRDLLYGLILPSGNDAAEALADSSSVGRENFVYLMNKKAESLGLTDTYFTNPSGLEGDGNQYSTAYDLLVITRYALQNPEFAKIVATYEHEIADTSTNKYYHLFNDTNLLTTYPGVKGVKTGFTYEAGMCLVTYLEYGGHKIIAVLLNSQNRREEMKQLLDYSLESLGVTPPKHQ